MIKDLGLVFNELTKLRQGMRCFDVLGCVRRTYNRSVAHGLLGLLRGAKGLRPSIEAIECIEGYLNICKACNYD